MEAVKAYMDNMEHGAWVKALFCILILLIAWVYALENSTTSSFIPLATSSYNDHSSGLAAVSMSTSIITAVAKPFIAKIADSTSRPFTYIFTLTFFVVRFTIVAASHKLSAYVAGVTLGAVGLSGITLMDSLIIADLTPLKWRGAVISILSTPYIINVWFAGLIVNDLKASNWRWGYGMFAIMMFVVVLPGLILMLHLDKKANAKADAIARSQRATTGRKRGIAKNIWIAFIEIDGPGLLIIGFGFALFLLPFAMHNKNSVPWSSTSIIVMLTIGATLLVFLIPYEMFIAPYPVMPKRVINRTLICSIIIDFFYQFGGEIGSIYFSSYTYVVLDLSYKNWSYFSNTLTLGLCFFGVVAGLTYRFTHRYKPWQILGLSIRLIGTGIRLDGHSGSTSLAALACAQLLNGMSGGFSVVGSSVALQASVPHEDLAVAISILSLWSNVAASIGYAVAVIIWHAKVPAALRKHLPDTVTDAQVTKFFNSIVAIRAYPYDSEIRQACIAAYKEASYYLFAPPVGIAAISLIAGCFQTSYYLGNRHNAVEEKSTSFGNTDSDKEREEREKEARTWGQKLRYFFF
ncbi:hypothetical protein KL906_001103 [Ogataea polymorpha]|nr:hypothetical protein KL906_001103 [Ogataea polymorpha]